jgi:hypothetical protein
MVRILLVAVHGHALTVPAKFTVGRWRDVVDLRGGLDKVLQMGAGKEVAKVDEFAVGLVLDY